MAEDAAKQRLAVELPALPLARGGTLKDSLTPGSATQERIKKVIDRAITIAATPQTDGSWNVTLAVPIEAVRLALINDHGIRTMADRSDLGPPIVILEGVTTKPAVGQVVGGWAAAVLWMKDVPAWAADARLVSRICARSARLTGFTICGRSPR